MTVLPPPSAPPLLPLAAKKPENVNVVVAPASRLDSSTLSADGPAAPLSVVVGPSSSKTIMEPISAVAVEDCNCFRVKPPISKSAWVWPEAFSAAPFSIRTRLWSTEVV